MKKIRKIVLALMTLICVNGILSPQQASALGSVSRACQHSTIPAQFPFIITTYIGQVTKQLTRDNLPAYTSYYKPLFAQTPGLEQRYWSLESFTTDYWQDGVFVNETSARYWLYAAADTWVLSNIDSSGNVIPPSLRKYEVYKSFESGWVSDPQTTDIPKLPGYENVPTPLLKVFLFRARAGTETPGFIDRFFVDTSYTVGYGFFPVTPIGFKIQGLHFYYNPMDGFVKELPPLTTATNNCNFTNWGFALERLYQ
jgi:hypothetical protein